MYIHVPTLKQMVVLGIMVYGNTYLCLYLALRFSYLHVPSRSCAFIVRGD